MRTRLVLTTGLAAVSLLALAACAPGSGGDGGSGAGGTGDGGTGSSGGLAGCLEGSWEADLDDLAAQLQAFFVEKGTPVTSTTSDGRSTLDVDADSMAFDSTAVFTMIAVTSDLDMQIVQEQIGQTTGQWSVDGDEALFADWEGGITITTTITIGGETAGDATETPAFGDGDVPIAIVCSGDSLTTKPDASPFTTTWARVG